MVMTKSFGRLFSRRFLPTLTNSVRYIYKHPELFPSLEQRLAALNVVDPEVSAPVDIGLPDPAKQHGTSKNVDLVKIDPVEKRHLMDAALTRTLEVDLEKVRKAWEKEGLLNATYMSAAHYGLFTDMYRHGHFLPRVVLHVNYPYSDTQVTPIHRGNILTASEVKSVPEVTFDSSPEDMWLLVVTNLDGHLNDSEAEYVHWFIGNIKGSDLTSGDELLPYLPPFPVRGTGYHRLVFTLYKQDNGHVQFKFPGKVEHRYNLKERTFKTFDFYKSHQDFITPAGLCFCQVTWDSSVTHIFHNLLEMREPVYEYERKEKLKDPQKIYPELLPFNKYLDQYRDPKEIRQEVLLKRLKSLDPFKEEPPMPKYPNIHLDLNLPSWYLPLKWQENNRIGRFRDLRPHSVYEQPEFDFERDMRSKKAGQDSSTSSS